MTTESMNPYQPPKAPLEISDVPGASGSLEDAIAGRYDFQIEQVMSEAWKLTKGFKASFWGAAVILYVGFLAVTLIATMLIGKTGNIAISMIVNGVIGALAAPLMMGLIMMSIRRASGLPVTFATAFGSFNKTPTALVAGLLVMLLTYVGLALLIVPGVYLGLAYQMTMPLIGDRNLGAWRAMETSRKAMTHKWFRFFGLYLVVGLLTGLSALPLGIPLIWTMPWAVMTMGVAYRKVFGSAQATEAA